MLQRGCGERRAAPEEVDASRFCLRLACSVAEA